MELRRVRLTDPLVEPLLQGLAEEYSRRYGLAIGTGEMATTPARQFEAPDGAFVVLLDQDRTVAGGGVRRLSPTTCEVKRMWTAPDRRRRGLASVVLAALEEAGRDLGYRRIRLSSLGRPSPKPSLCTGPAATPGSRCSTRTGVR